MRRTRLGILAGTLAAAAATADPPLRVGVSEPLALDAERRQRLEGGEILVEELPPSDGTGLAARALGIVDAPPARVWPVVRDCHRFAEFMPRTKRSERRWTEDGAPTCHLVIDLPFPLGELRSEVRYTLEALPGEGFRRRWSHHAGDYHRNDGSWTVLPWGDEDGRTLVVYRSDAHAKRALPDFVVRSARARQLPATYRAIAARAAALAAESDAAGGGD